MKISKPEIPWYSFRECEPDVLIPIIVTWGDGVYPFCRHSGDYYVNSLSRTCWRLEELTSDPEVFWCYQEQLEPSYEWLTKKEDSDESI